MTSSVQTAPFNSQRNWLLVLALIVLVVAGAVLSDRFARTFEVSQQAQQENQLGELANAYRTGAQGTLSNLEEQLQSLRSYLQHSSTIDAATFTGMAQNVLDRNSAVRAVALVESIDPVALSSRSIDLKQRNWLGEFQLQEIASSPIAASVDRESEALAAITQMLTQTKLDGAFREQLNQYLGLAIKGDLNLSYLLDVKANAVEVRYRSFLPGGALIALPYGSGSQPGVLIADIEVASLFRTQESATALSTSRLLDITELSGMKQIFPAANQAVEGIEERLADKRRDLRTGEFSALGRKFLVETLPLTRFYQSLRSQTPTLVRVGGTLVTALAVLLIYGLITRNARVQRLVDQRGNELKNAYEQIRDSEIMSMQSEKMSSLGQMVAGVAHEINTPLAFATSNVELLKERMDKVVVAVADQGNLVAQLANWKELDQTARNQWYREAVARGEQLDRLRTRTLKNTDALVDESLEGLNRVRDLVATLKDFSRVDRAPVDQVDLHQCLENTLKIAHNVVKHKAEVVREYGQLPLVRCNPSQINQVLLNLITNAAQAIPNFGEIRLRTSLLNAERVRIDISDTGSGMDAATQKRVFEAFFTTKGSGEGTGLGLAICDKIVRNHGGEIQLQSSLGDGTTFSVILPISGPVEAPSSNS